jgi:hypothetical protein
MMSHTLISSIAFTTGFTSLCVFSPYAAAVQLTDPTFDASVTTPAYSTAQPKVLFDEAHFNVHTAAGSYKPFVTLTRNDGYAVEPSKNKFSGTTLKEQDILVIANALGSADPDTAQASNAAFTETECDAVADWVRNGGALLLITDHEPSGAAAENLARRFGVAMGKGTAFRKSALYKSDLGPPAWFLFSRDNGLLGDHPITQGRSAAERLNRVLDFTGQSLSVPEGAAAFLKLGDDAFEIVDGTMLEKLSPANVMQMATPASGRAQGVALPFGKGRVVIVGEAAMLTAAVDHYKNKNGEDEESRSGMAEPRFDDKQLLLNIMHWLSKLLN